MLVGLILQKVMAKENKKTIDTSGIFIISTATYLLRRDVTTVMNNTFFWEWSHGKTWCEFYIDFDRNVMATVNWVGDTKTYLALAGLAHQRGFGFEDLYTMDE